LSHRLNKNAATCGVPLRAMVLRGALVGPAEPVSTTFGFGDVGGFGAGATNNSFSSPDWRSLPHKCGSGWKFGVSRRSSTYARYFPEGERDMYRRGVFVEIAFVTWSRDRRPQEMSPNFQATLSLPHIPGRGSSCSATVRSRHVSSAGRYRRNRYYFVKANRAAVRAE